MHDAEKLTQVWRHPVVFQVFQVYAKVNYALPCYDWCANQSISKQHALCTLSPAERKTAIKRLVHDSINVIKTADERTGSSGRAEQCHRYTAGGSVTETGEAVFE